jgi:hypothetical protein
LTEPVGRRLFRACNPSGIACLRKAPVKPGYEHQIAANDLRRPIIDRNIRADGARDAAKKAIRQADCAEAEARSIRMEGYGGPAQPAPTIAQCPNGRLGWLEVEYKRCKTRASLPLDSIRRPRDFPIWKLEASLKGRSHKKAATRRPCI